jgi:hypothetical protein
MIRLKDLIKETQITPDDINRILKRTGDEQDLTDPYWDDFTPDICNTGFCDIFAKKFREEYPGAEVWGTDWGTAASPGGHVWIKYRGRYYDAETPNGVVSWKKIPFIQRLYNITKKYPTYPKDVYIIRPGASNN